MNLSYSRKPSKQQGFLLLEYLVALALFAMILLYADSIFALHSRVKRQVETQHNQITQLRQITLQLHPMIAQAGYLGCQNIRHAENVMIHEGIDTQLSYGQAIYIDMPDVLEGKVLEETDVLMIEQVGDWTVSLQETMETPGASLYLPNVEEDTEGWFIIDDCTDVEVFYGNVYHSNNQTIIQPSQPLNKAYHQQAIISPWIQQAIYLRDDFTLQQKSLLPDESSMTLHESIYDWKLTLGFDVLEINTTLTEDFVLWFGY